MQNFERVRKTKAAGDISSIFASLSTPQAEGERQHYTALKAKIAANCSHERLRASYLGAQDAIRAQVDNLRKVRARGDSIIPEISFKELQARGPSQSFVAQVKQVGTVIVRGVVPVETAIRYKHDTKEYARRNNASGYPKTNPQVWEIYWAKAQLEARSCPNMLQTQAWINSLWHSSAPDVVDPTMPLTYVDRLRIRNPGDRSFALGDHVDGGGVERWEDEHYRSVYREIFNGNWEAFDNLDVTNRVRANMNLHDAPGGCSVFRGYQGWLSLSQTGPGEGTLRVNPFPKEAAAYWLLRPFFNKNNDIDLQSSTFHGATPGKGQEFDDVNHEHLILRESMETLPEMNPGDAVFWHTDVIHAVESVHDGKHDSSVFYIPAISLCDMNVRYLRGQREDFMLGVPPEDFPGGAGETNYIGRGTCEDVLRCGGLRSLQSMGLAPLTGDTDLIQRANRILFA